MGPKDRLLFHKFLLKIPFVICAVIAFVIVTALAASQLWPEVKEWVADRAAELGGMMTWWALATFIVVALIWLWGVLATRDRDDMSLEGTTIGGHTVGDDNRKGIFNEAPNQGTQNYYEGTQQRIAPPQLVDALRSAAESRLTVQVRIYGQDHEMQTYGRDLARGFAEAGFNVILFDGDHGTRYLTGVVVEPAPNSASRTTGSAIATALSSCGISVNLQDGPNAWSEQSFVRVGIGGNA